MNKINLLTIKDFYDFAKRHNFKIEEKLCMTRGKLRKCPLRKLFDNFLTESIIKRAIEEVLEIFKEFGAKSVYVLLNYNNSLYEVNSTIEIWLI